jgi:hypothetical protein
MAVVGKSSVIRFAYLRVISKRTDKSLPYSFRPIASKASTTSELLISTRDFRRARKITWCMICGLDGDGREGETES